jgi:hypothetical protein
VLVDGDRLALAEANEIALSDGQLAAADDAGG